MATEVQLAKARGIYRSARAAAQNAEKTTADVAEVTGKVKRLVPNRRAAAAIGVGGTAAVGAANGGATYVGARKGTKDALKKSDQRRDAAALGSGLAAGGAAFSAGRSLRQADRGQAQLALGGKLSDEASAAGREAFERRMGMQRPTPGGVRTAGNLQALANNKSGRAAAATRAGTKAIAGAKRSAGAAAVLGAGAAAGATLIRKPKTEQAKSASGVARSAREGFRQSGGRVLIKPNIKVSGGTKAERVAGRAGYAAKTGGVIVGAGGAGAAAVETRHRLQKAFDAERSRHRRADVATGVAAGGAIVGADRVRRDIGNAKSSVAYGKTQRKEAATKYGRVADQSSKLSSGKVTGGAAAAVGTSMRRGVKQAAGHEEAAQKAFRSARKFGGRAAAVGAASAVAGGAAYGLHRADKKGSGRSYGYR